MSYQHYSLGPENFCSKSEPVGQEFLNTFFVAQVTGLLKCNTLNRVKFSLSRPASILQTLFPRRENPGRREPTEKVIVSVAERRAIVKYKIFKNDGAPSRILEKVWTREAFEPGEFQMIRGHSMLFGFRFSEERPVGGRKGKQIRSVARFAENN